MTKEEENKIKELNKSLKEEENKINNLNRSLQQREILKLMQSMDKSRSSLHHQDFPNTKSKNKSEEKLPIIKVPQKEVKGKKGNKGKKNPLSANKSLKSSASAKKSKIKKKK